MKVAQDAGHDRFWIRLDLEESSKRLGRSPMRLDEFVGRDHAAAAEAVDHHRPAVHIHAGEEMSGKIAASDF